MIASKTNKKGFFFYFLLLLIALYCVSCIASIFSFGLSRGIQVATLVILFIQCFYVTSEIKNITNLLVIYIIIILSYRLTGYSGSGWGNCLMQISFFIPIVYIFYAMNRRGMMALKVLYYFILALVVYAVLRDFFIGRVNVYAELSELGEEGSAVASTEFNTMVYFTYNVSLIVLLNVKEKIPRLIHIGILFLTFYYIIFMGMRGSLAIYLFLSTFVILYIKYTRKNAISRLIGALGAIFFVLLLFIDTQPILNFLIAISPNERLADRFRDISMVQSAGISEDSFSGRLSLEMISIRTWTRNPITFFFGIGDHRFSDWGIYGLIKSGIGGHAELIDSLARFGLIGFTIIILLIQRIGKYVVTLFENGIAKKQVVVFFLILVLLGLTKGLFFHFIGIACFLLLPCSATIINQYNK